VIDGQWFLVQWMTVRLSVSVAGYASGCRIGAAGRWAAFVPCSIAHVASVQTAQCHWHAGKPGSRTVSRPAVGETSRLGASGGLSVMAVALQWHCANAHAQCRIRPAGTIRLLPSRHGISVIQDLAPQ
jgi:hypothetical protein